MRISHRELLACVLSLLIGAALLTSSIDRIPGLHFDEVSSIAMASSPDRLTQGLQSYTGTLYYHLVGWWMGVFGFTPSGLRLFSATLACLACVVGMVAVRRVAPQAGAAAWFACLLATSPTFVMESRIGWEATAMHPVLGAAGILAAIAAFGATRRWPAIALALTAGLALGAAAAVHVSAVALLPAVVAGAWIVQGRSLLRHHALGAILVGFVVALVPRLLHVLTVAGSESSLVGFDLESVPVIGWSRAALADAAAVPWVLVRMCDGALLYRRMCGAAAVPVVPYVLLAVVGLVWMRWRNKPAGVRLDRTERAAWFGLAVFLVVIYLITPYLALRYFLLPALFVPYLIVSLALPLLSSASRSARRWATILLASVLCLNLAYLGANYYLQFERTGGKATVFAVGLRVEHTSENFIRTDRLWQQLATRRVGLVVAQWPIASTLSFYRSNAGHPMRIAPSERLPEKLPAVAGGSALVFYEGQQVKRPDDPRGIDLDHQDDVLIGSTVYRKDPTFDHNFLVYVEVGEGARTGLGPSR